MYVEGRVLASSGEPIPGAVIETWETDEKGERAFDRVLLTVHRHNVFNPPRLLRYSVHGPLRT
jgi:hypothetical protein